MREFAIIGVNASRLLADSQIREIKIITIWSIDTSRLIDYQHVNWVLRTRLIVFKLSLDIIIVALLNPTEFQCTDS